MGVCIYPYIKTNTKKYIYFKILEPEVWYFVCLFATQSPHFVPIFIYFGPFDLFGSMKLLFNDPHNWPTVGLAKGPSGLLPFFFCHFFLISLPFAARDQIMPIVINKKWPTGSVIFLSAIIGTEEKKEKNKAVHFFFWGGGGGGSSQWTAILKKVPFFAPFPYKIILSYLAEKWVNNLIADLVHHLLYGPVLRVQQRLLVFDKIQTWSWQRRSSCCKGRGTTACVRRADWLCVVSYSVASSKCQIASREVALVRFLL